jgi:hypothetical protein
LLGAAERGTFRVRRIERERKLICNSVLLTKYAFDLLAEIGGSKPQPLAVGRRYRRAAG